jgi:hypothetical protein
MSTLGFVMMVPHALPRGAGGAALGGAIARW